MTQHADGVPSIEIEIAAARIIFNIASFSANEAQGETNIVVGRKDVAILGFF